MKKTILEYQKNCYKIYKNEIGYPSHYTYIYGNPINVLVPIETALNKYMVVGAYPSAKFFTINGIKDVPLLDNDSPFSNESYFDGSRVRTIPSGEELNEVILNQIGIKREDCWVTDLVKVFLFKEGHIKKYRYLGKKDLKENRSKFDDYAKESLKWLYEEIDIANPKLIILLGVEVTKHIFNTTSDEAKSFLNGEVMVEYINGVTRNFVCIPHPGILMRHSTNNPWPKIFREEIAPKVKSLLSN